MPLYKGGAFDGRTRVGSITGVPEARMGRMLEERMLEERMLLASTLQDSVVQVEIRRN